jgi:hypothetical protein
MKQLYLLVPCVLGLMSPPANSQFRWSDTSELNRELVRVHSRMVPHQEARERPPLRRLGARSNLFAPPEIVVQPVPPEAPVALPPHQQQRREALWNIFESLSGGFPDDSLRRE